MGRERATQAATLPSPGLNPRQVETERQLAAALRRQRADARSVYGFLLDQVADAAERLAEGYAAGQCCPSHHAT